MKKIILYSSILLMVAGCQGMAVKREIIQNYYLVAADDREDCILSYHETKWSDFLGGVNYGGLIDATVFAVGYNDEYMIVKQHPLIYTNPPTKKVTNYFIMPLKEGMDWRSKNGLIGPLTFEEFNNKMKVLNISDKVTFTLVLSDLE